MKSIRRRVQQAIPDGKVIELPKEWMKDNFPSSGRRESPSSFTNYMTCPLSWFMNRYAPLPYEEEYSFPMVAGTFVHRALEIFYSELPRNRTEGNLKKILQHAWVMLKDHNTEDGAVDEQLVNQFIWLENHENNIDAFHGRFYKKSRECINNSLLFDPQPSMLNIRSTEGWVRGEKNGIRINGKIDRVIMTPDDFEIVDDYKTGRPPQIEPDEDGRVVVDVLDPSFISVGMYAWMKTMDKNSDFPVKSVRLLFLSHQARYAKRINDEVIETVDTMVDQVTQQMNEVSRTGELVVNPADGPNQYPCIWCPIKDTCPVWTGTDNLDAVREQYGV